jgi:hypothetical protein
LRRVGSASFDILRPLHMQERSAYAEFHLDHLFEILRLQELRRDPGAISAEPFDHRLKDNLESRCMNKYVFDTKLVARRFDFVVLELLIVELVEPNHVIAVARAEGVKPENARALSTPPDRLWNNPFPGDRHGTATAQARTS